MSCFPSAERPHNERVSMDEKPNLTPNGKMSSQQYRSTRNRLLRAAICNPARTTLILAAVMLLVNFGLYLARCGAANYYGIGFDQVSAHYDSSLYSFALMAVFSAGLILINAIGYLIASQNKSWRAFLFTGIYALGIFALFFIIFVVVYSMNLGQRTEDAALELLGTLAYLSLIMTFTGIAPGIIMSFSLKFGERRAAKAAKNATQVDPAGKGARSLQAHLLFDAAFLVVCSVAITALTLGYGFSLEKSRTDYAIWTNETGNKYVIVYQDDNRWCLEQCEIADGNLTIDTNAQLWKSPLGIEVEKKHFDSVAKRADAEEEAYGQSEPAPEPGPQGHETEGSACGELLPAPLLVVLAVVILMLLYLRFRHDGSPTGDAKHPFLRMTTILVGTLFLAVSPFYLAAYWALSILAEIAPGAAIPAFFALYLAGIVVAALIGCRQMRRASLRAWESLPEEAADVKTVTKQKFIRPFDTLTLVCWVLCQVVSVAAIMIAVSGLVYDTSFSNIHLLLWVGWIYPLAFDAEYVSRILKRKDAL